MLVNQGFILFTSQTLVWYKLRASITAFRPAIRYFSRLEIVDELARNLSNEGRRVKVEDIDVVRKSSSPFIARTHTGLNVRLCSVEVVWNESIDEVLKVLRREDLIILPAVLRETISQMKRAKRRHRPYPFSFQIQ